MSEVSGGFLFVCFGGFAVFVWVLVCVFLWGFWGGRHAFFCWHSLNVFQHQYFRLVIHPNTVHTDEKVNPPKKRKH